MNEIDVIGQDQFGGYLDSFFMVFDDRIGVDVSDGDGIVSSTTVNGNSINYEINSFNFDPNFDTYHIVEVIVVFPPQWSSVARVTVRGTDTQGLEDEATTDIVTGIEPEPPVISPASGTYEFSVTISMSSPDGDDIYYTLDGSIPTSSSNLYTGPFTLSSTSYEGESWTVKAVTYVGGDYSEVVTNYYTVYNPCPPPQIICKASPPFLTSNQDTDNTVELFWQDKPAEANALAARYVVERADDSNGFPGTYHRIATLGAKTFSYRQLGLQPNISYWYRVSKINTEGKFYFPDQIKVTLPESVSPKALRAVRVEIEQDPRQKLSKVRMINNSNKNNLDKVAIAGEFNFEIKGMIHSQPIVVTRFDKSDGQEILAFEFVKTGTAVKPGEVVTKAFRSTAKKDFRPKLLVTVHFDDGSLLSAPMIPVDEDLNLLVAEFNDLNQSSLDEGKQEIPTQFALHQNYPNPFNPTTEISYALPKHGYVTLTIFNMTGQRIRTLVDEQKSAGYYTILWDGQDEFGHEVASGMYVYHLLVRPEGAESQPFKQVKKMTLLR